MEIGQKMGPLFQRLSRKQAACRNARLEFRREWRVETGERALGRVTVLFLCLFENSFGGTQGGERRNPDRKISEE